MNKETIEEAAIRLFNDFQKNNPIVPKNNINPYKLGFINGAKWQAEKSEEDILEFANWCRIQDNKHPNRVVTTQQLFEQFKKKSNE
jgi:hypothetical protein